MSLVLIHGSNLTSDCWSNVIPHLTAQALAVNLPGRKNGRRGHEPPSYATMADSVIADMDAADLVSATVLGHSMAGEVLRALALRYPERIERLIFISAIVLRSGECLCDVLDPAVQSLFNSFRAQGQSVFEYPREIAVAVCNDMDQVQLNMALTGLVPDWVTPFFEIAPNQPWPENSPPCTYIKLLNDVVFPESLQDRFIARLPAPQVLSLNTGHIAMISRPMELANLLNTIVS